MKIFTRILFFFATLFCTLAASAQGKSYIGYCDGQIASSSSGRYTAVGSAGSEVNLAIRLSKNMLAAYKGNSIVAVNYGMPTSQGLPKFNVWVRATRDGENITEGTCTSTSYGWHEVSVKPYTITGDEDELWIGATYNNTSKTFVAVSFAGTTLSDGCHVNGGNGWTNYASNGWGSLSLEAVIEGGNVPTRDLSLLDVKSSHRAVKLGNTFTVTGTIKNNASETAVNPVIQYSINGTRVGTYTHNGSLAHRATAPFTITVPTDGFDQCDAQVQLSLEWADGVADDAPADNTETLTVSLTKSVFTRRMVVEEHTGAWCAWCVRGIVGLKEMKEKYGDDFIGIGIHNNDAYVVGAYDNFISGYMSGFPNSIVNRTGSAVDPSYVNLNNRYMAMEKVANADINLDVAYTTDKNLIFNSKSEFAYSEPNADYRVVFVVLENQLPISQKNAYAGGGNVMGGFESMGSTVQMDIDDVARGIYPSTTGTAGSLPAIINQGSIYDYSYTAKAPAIKNGKNVEVVALLINGKTGEIINARKTDRIKGLTYGDPVPGEGGGEDPEKPSGTLSHTIAPADGSTVAKLDKVTVSFEGSYADAGMTHVGYYNYISGNYGESQVPVSGDPYLRDDAGKVVATAVRVMWANNPKYTGINLDDIEPYDYKKFDIQFDGVPAGHYTLVIPKYTFVYYDNEDYLCGTNEFTAQYTVTEGSASVLGNYDVRFSPAEFSELQQWGIVDLYSNDNIFDYDHSDLPYYNYYYIDTPRRPYCILPNAQEQEAKTIDYVEVTGVSSSAVQIRFTFPTSYTQGTYTLVVPDNYLVLGDSNQPYVKWWCAYGLPERRFTFFVGAAPEGIAAPTTDHAPATVYDLWGRSGVKASGFRVEGGRKVIR